MAAARIVRRATLRTAQEIPCYPAQDNYKVISPEDMQLEFLADGADECPLLRFYRWGDCEVSLLREAAAQLAAGATPSIEVHQLPFIEAVGGITFTWVADRWERGVLLPHDQRSFIMQLPSELWADVVEVIRSYENSDIAAFTWLLPVTDVRVLLSWSGQW